MFNLHFAARTSTIQGSKRTLLACITRRQIASAASDTTTRGYPRHELPAVLSTSDRREAIKNAKPFSSFLTDTFQRKHDYLRISITEKCNLRCLYCMPEEGVPQSPPPDLLTTPEIYLLSSIFVSQGVTKIRLTGGEPTVRRDILPLMHQIGSLRSQGLRELCLTTNGISLHRKLDSMVEAGLTGINLSLDTLDPWQFQIMTRRKGFEAVMKSIQQILELNKLGAKIKLKINCVVMRGINDREIIPFVEMGQEHDLEVRFIEYMPFDGNKWSQGKMLSYKEMVNSIRDKYPTLRKVVNHQNDTSKTYKIPGFVGRIGFITSMTHNFCGTCNRLRITSDGNLKVCLFGNAEVSLRDILRKSNSGNPIDEEAFEAMKQFEMSRKQCLLPPQSPLGQTEHERELLEVIGMAVSKKKEKHAGMGELENMKNRPMILIGEPYHQIQPKMRKINSSQHFRIPVYHLLPNHLPSGLRFYSSKSDTPMLSKLTHLNPSGSAHMVSISEKSVTARIATAVCTIYFSNNTALPLIRSNSIKKGDVLSVARIAGIMAAKKTSDLVPLCHPIAITHVSIELDPRDNNVNGSRDKESVTAGWSAAGLREACHVSSRQAEDRLAFGSIDITATVKCEGKTGVEMEALTAASVAALTVYDMCKAVDKGIRIEGLRVIHKEGGESGSWKEGQPIQDVKAS